MKLDKKQIEENMAHQMANMKENPSLLSQNLQKIKLLPPKQRKMIKKLLPKEFQDQFDKI